MDNPSQPNTSPPQRDRWPLFWRFWWSGAVLVMALFAASFVLPGELALGAFMASFQLLVLMTLPVSLAMLPLIDMPLPNLLDAFAITYLVYCAITFAASYWLWKRLEAWTRGR